MASSSKKRKAADELWEKHEAIAISLYTEKNLTLAQVKEVLEKEYGLTLTRGQLEGRLRRLGLKKYNTSTAWKYIAENITDRARNGKISVVYIDGNMVPDKKLQKETNRYGYESIIEKLKRERGPREISNPPRGVIVRTPPPASSEGMRRWHHANIVPCEAWTRLPWNEFLAYLDATTSNNVRVCEPIDPIFSCVDWEAIESNTGFFVIPLYIQPRVSNFLVELNHTKTMVQLLLQRLKDTIPPSHILESSINISSAINDSGLYSRLEFFKPVIYIFSNSIDIGFKFRDLYSLVIELLQCSNNRRLLEQFSMVDIHTIKAFAEALLRTAKIPDRKMMKLLLDLEVQHTKVRKQNRLFHHAVEYRDIPYALCLLEQVIGIVTLKDLDDVLRKGPEEVAFAVIRNLAASGYFGKYATEILKSIATKCKNSIQVMRFVIESYWCEIRPCINHFNFLYLLDAATKYSSREVVEYLITRIGKTEFPNLDFYNRALLSASASYISRLDTIEYLLSEGANVNFWEQRSSGGWDNPLREAIMNSSWEVVNYLLDAGADPNPPPWVSIQFHPVLQIAENMRHSHRVPFQIRALASLFYQSRTNITRNCSKAAAADIAYPSTQTLKEAGYLGDAENDRYSDAEKIDRLPIRFESIRNHPYSFRALKRSRSEKFMGAVLGFRITGRPGTNLERRLLNMALAGVRTSLVELIQELPGHGATINDALKLINPSESEAASTAQVLIANGANNFDQYQEVYCPEVYLNYGLTLLQHAAACGNIKLCEVLIDGGANINSPAWQGTDMRGRTALQAAAEKGFSEVAELLLRKGADVNAIPGPYQGATALQFAAANGNFTLVQNLLEAGANINALPATHFGFTALEGAALYGRLDMTRFLLNVGADISGPENSQYHRAVEFSRRNGHIVLSDYLQDYKKQFFPNEC